MLRRAMGLTLTLFRTQPCLEQPVQPRSAPYSSLGLRVQLATSLQFFSCEKQVNGVEVSKTFWSDNYSEHRNRGKLEFNNNVKIIAQMKIIL